MNNTLKQLQEKGEEEFDKEFLGGGQWDCVSTEDGDYYTKEQIIDFLHQQTTLAFEAGKAEAIAMVLKEIEQRKVHNPGKPDTDGTYYEHYDFGYRAGYNQALDTLKTKLQAKE